MAHEIDLNDGALRVGGAPFLTGVPAGATPERPGTGPFLLNRVPGAVTPESAESALFLRLSAPAPSERLVLPLGDLSGIRWFTCCHRYEPYWMTAKAGTRGGEVPPETQFLLVEREDGACVLLVPLLDGAFWMALQGAGEDGLELVAESGDPDVTTGSVVGLYVAAGENPYSLVEQAAAVVAERLGTGRLRVEKEPPGFLDHFGWCTWDAFYQEVSAEKVREGLQSFRAGGVPPRLLILDDGWQSVRQMPSGERRLTAFAANGKFPGDLRPVVEMAKREFGVLEFLVWHAMNGYWGGVDGESLPGYDVRDQPRRSSPGIRHHQPGVDEWWGGTMGVVSPEGIYRFFQDYHRHLRLQGVDGVKVDNQAALESVASGLGGRVALMRAYREAMEGSAGVHFQGRLINCMSCSNDMLYSALATTLTRTSTDFWPKRPESHGLHLYVNAQVSLWFGEFVQPDWDMFQSGHRMGSFHAAGRAVSGGPVYVSDKPGEHDFDLLRKLVIPGGYVLRTQFPGRPTRDCLFHDPTKEEVLLKIFSRNRPSGILGVFNARYTGESEAAGEIAGVVRPSDVEGMRGERFAVYAHRSRELRVLGRDEEWPVSLPELEWEIFTVSPVRQGVAVMGAPGMLNSGGAVLGVWWNAPDEFEFQSLTLGTILLWSEREPAEIEVDDEPVPFTYDAGSGRLEVELTPRQEGSAQVWIRFGE